MRPAAVTALQVTGGNRDEVMPLLPDLPAGIVFFWITAAADILREIGLPAQAALLRLRELLAHMGPCPLLGRDTGNQRRS